MWASELIGEGSVQYWDQSSTVYLKGSAAATASHSGEYNPHSDHYIPFSAQKHGECVKGEH